MALAALRKEIASAVEKAFGLKLEMSRFGVEYTAEQKFGDITTNAAMVYARDLKLAPREAANKLVAVLGAELTWAKHVEVAGPGFINIWLTDDALGKMAAEALKDKPNGLAGQTVVAEYSDPNPFKVLHAGHLYTSVVGDAIANLLESGGATVHRVNSGGDVGLHVGKTL